MKTLLVTLDYPPMLGGVAAYWQRLRQTVGSEKLIVLTSVPGPEEAGVIRQPLFFHYIWPHWLRAIGVVRRVYREQGCDQIMVGQVLPFGVVAHFLHRFFGIPYVVQVYGMDLMMAQRSAIKRQIVKHVLADSRHSFANSAATGALLESFGVSADRYTVVYPIPETLGQGIGAAGLDKKYDLAGKRIVLCVGRLVERKGQDMLIHAAARLRAQYPNLVVALVGDGPDQDRLQQLVQQEQAPVVLTGRVSHDERDAWFQRCEIFAMPGRALPGDMEGFGMVYLEAASAGKPSIAGRSGGMSEAVIDNETGLLVDGSSLDEVTTALDRLLSDSALRQRLGKEGQRRMQTVWSWEAMVKRLAL